MSIQQIKVSDFCPTCGRSLPTTRTFRAHCSDACAIVGFCRRHGLSVALVEAERRVAKQNADAA
jgi:hypothetical protein